MLPKSFRSAAPSFLPLTIKVAASTLLAVLLASPLALQAQTTTAAYSINGSGLTPNRLTSQIVENSRVTLTGSVHPLATRANDRGQLADSVKLERIQVVLKRSDAQEAGLKRLLTDLHAPGSANYHKWLTPESFGTQFGPSDADVATLETWLQSKGFVMTKLAAGRQVLEITGTAGQLRNTFHTEMHQYAVGGTTRYANATAPEIPSALAPVFGGFVSLNNFRYRHDAKVLGKARLNAVTHETKPDWTVGTSSAISLILAPSDFAIQYDLNPVYAVGTKGDGQTIAVVNESNINVALVNSYRSLFGLPVNPPQVVIDGNDPGIDGINSPLGPNGASGEAYLDVELAGAVAPNAQIDLVIANDTAVANGLTLAMEHAVFSNIAPVISLSFGKCEANEGTSNGFTESLWEQAAAQGQTVVVSTGDNGSAGCDFGTQFAVNGQAVNGLASTPFNVAVGGTDFYYSGGSSTVSNYWNTTPSNSTPTVSLTARAPEQPWNNSQYALNLIEYDSTGAASTIVAASGGPSTLGNVGGTAQSPTYGPYPKPSWQTGAGVPADGARDLPDLSLFAANGYNASYYPICAGDADCQAVSSGQKVQITGIGGTSAATPAFAGMMALVNQKYGRQGQANYILYPLAAQFPATFHDVTAGTITVPCATTTVFDSDNSNQSIAPKNCKTVSSGLTVTDSRYGQTTEGELSVDGTNAAYNATAGYDLATGLGTVDANNLVTNWGKISLAATTTTLIPSPTSFAHGTAVNFTGTVTGSGTPTGDVALVTTSTDPNNQGQAFFPLGNGAYNGSVSYLPGGSYTVSGYYSGDGVNGPSSSTPVPVTVTPEASATSLRVYTALNPATQVSSAAVSYGAPNVLSAIAGPTTGTTTTAPTGTVIFLDGSTAVNTAVVNANGDAQYNGAFAVGSHTVTAKYSGDTSYAGSTSAAVAFTVGKNSPAIKVSTTYADQNNNAVTGQATYITVQLINSASVNGLALPPTGAISISGAPSGTPATAALVPAVVPDSVSGLMMPESTASFAIPTSASGTFTLTFNYAGDSNYAVASISGTLTFDPTAGTSTTTTATASLTATSPTSRVTVNTTVTSSGSTRPTGTVYLISSRYILAQTTLATGSGNSASVSLSFDSATLLQGTNQITVQYIPDTGSFGASAAEVTIANPLSDFTMVPASTILSVPATGTGAGFQTDVINLTSTNGFSGAVSFTCAGAGGVTCSLTPASVTLASAGSTSTTLLVDTGTISTPGSYNVVVTGKNAAGTVIHTLGLVAVTQQTAATPRFTLTATGVSIAAPGGSGTSTVVITPANGFTGTVALTCNISGTAPSTAIYPTCAATSANVPGTNAVTTTITITTDASTPAGSYTALVKGDSGSLESTASFSLTVGTVGSPAFTLAGTAVTIASQGASGTSTITVTPTNSFTGTVALTCAVTSAPSGANTSSNPTCSASSASVTGSSAATATLTINTTAQSARLDLPATRIFTAGGGVALGAMVLFSIPFTRRRREQIRSLRSLRMLSVAALLLLALGSAIGCGSGGSTATPLPPSGGTTTGSYTLTVTGTSGSTTATTTIVVTVN